MKKLTIEVENELSEHPEVRIIPEGDMAVDMFARIALFGYLAAAEFFCQNHKACDDCDAYLIHNSLRHRIPHFLAEVSSGKKP